MGRFLLNSGRSLEVGDNSEDTIASHFERLVMLTPDKLAIVTDTATYTYRELNALADRIAAPIGALRSSPDRPIILMIDDSPLLIAAMFAAAKARRIFIPLESDAPKSWLSGIVEHSGATHVIADPLARSTAAGPADDPVSILDVGRAGWTGLGPLAPTKTMSDSPACIMYTSGSAGRPKGVTLTHRGVLHRSTARSGRAQIDPNGRMAHLRAGGFVPGRTNIFATLFAGACVFPFEIKKRGLHSFASWLNTQRITGFTITSSLLRTWLASLPDDLRFPALRFVTCISEPLYGADVVCASKHLTGEWCLEFAYGTTEVGHIAGALIGPKNSIEVGMLPVGHIHAGQDVWLEDEDGIIAGPGKAGEVVIRSDYVASGYWNEPELTKATFPTDPMDGRRLYRTGDLARWRDDGQLQHLGRKDRRIKLRGHTIEPYEIECAVLRVPGVSDVTVVLVKDGPDDGRLIGYVASTNQISTTTIRDFLAKELPAYMIPSDVVVMKSLPLTISGKIDRKALPPPPQRIKASRSKLRVPSTSTERVLTSIWRDVLNVSTIGLDDNFYDLGGTSLKAFQIFARIANTLGYDLPPTIMISAPTIARQAETLRSASLSCETPIGLLPFREGGGRLPLFIVHGGFGDIMFAKELVRDMRNDHPVYGVQPPPLDGTRRFPQTVEAIATDYLAEVVKVQARGPYCLAGYSFGGWVALEMAQQLTRKGESVAFLGIIDTLGRSVEIQSARIRRHVRDLKRGAIVPYLSHRVTKTVMHHLVRVREAMRHFPNKARMWLSKSIPYSERAEFYLHTFSGIARRYVVQSYPGHVVVFSSTGRADLHRARWSMIARRGVTVHEVPGNHGNLVFPPQSARLAEALTESLSRIKS